MEQALISSWLVETREEAARGREGTEEWRVPVMRGGAPFPTCPNLLGSEPVLVPAPPHTVSRQIRAMFSTRKGRKQTKLEGR